MNIKSNIIKQRYQREISKIKLYSCPAEKVN